MPLSQEQIIELIKLVNKTDIGEVSIKDGDFSVKIRRRDFSKQVVQNAPAPLVAIPASQPVATVNENTKAETSSADASSNGKYHTINSPMIGTFYRSSAPDKEPFVKVGDHIEKGQVLCIIEAMKLFNEIESEVSGTIVKVLPDNASPVEYEQPLFLVDPQ
jgi:acetyl-CoA carboxylase biotin carboxyl carrier protein